MKSIAVFAGARVGEGASDHVEHAQALGRLLAIHGIRLVYGGSSAGLMGAVANACFDSDGHVVGVTTEHILSIEKGSPAKLTERIMTGSIAERRAKMFQLADAVVALPGGLGTLEELLEVWSGVHLRTHHKPLALLNSGGFWDPLLTWISALQSQGLVRKEPDLEPIVENDPDLLFNSLLQRAEHKAQP